MENNDAGFEGKVERLEEAVSRAIKEMVDVAWHTHTDPDRLSDERDDDLAKLLGVGKSLVRQVRSTKPGQLDHALRLGALEGKSALTIMLEVVAIMSRQADGVRHVPAPGGTRPRDRVTPLTAAAMVKKRRGRPPRPR